MADVPRMESLAHPYRWPTLDEMLQKTDRIIVGRVGAQKLAVVTEGERQREYLVSMVSEGDRDFIVAQATDLVCTNDGVGLGYTVNEPLLEVGETYAILVTTDEPVRGAYIVLPQILRDEGGWLNNLSTLSVDEQALSLNELWERYESQR